MKKTPIHFTITLLVGLLPGFAQAEDVLPVGSVVGPVGLTRPMQMLKSEMAGGRQSFLSALGNTAFATPLIFGGTARAAGMSCNGCHVNGDVNPAFYIPGNSGAHGSVDPSNKLFNPRAENDIADPVDIPSLRGIRFTAPYGRDGRVASLREFTRNVIVLEFKGEEPSPLILDALVAYMNELEFLPNRKIDAQGRLTLAAGPAAKRGEVVFQRPFASMGGKSCANCHQPSNGFIDRQSHDIGSGGRFDTPTLLNAASSAPYFHDGRFADFAAVVAHFNQYFKLGLSKAETSDLLAYLEAVSAIDEPEEQLSFGKDMAEIAVWVSALDTAISENLPEIVHFVVEATNLLLDQTKSRFPDGDAAHQSKRPDRHKRVPLDYAALQDGLRAVDAVMATGHRPEAAAALERYRVLADSMVANYPGADKAVAH